MTSTVTDVKVEVHKSSQWIHIQRQTNLKDLTRVKPISSYHKSDSLTRAIFMFEEDLKKMKLNEVGRQKLARQNSWQHFKGCC